MKNLRRKMARAAVIGKGPQRSALGNIIRHRIKCTAITMFIRRGYNGVTFLSLSKTIGINHSLIYYHFRTKAGLAEAVLKDVATIGIDEHRVIWTNPSGSLSEKFAHARDLMYVRFAWSRLRGQMQYPTGLVSRFWLDAESLTPTIRRLLEGIERQLEAFVEEAIRIAIERRELLADAPVKLIAMQVCNLMFGAGPNAVFGHWRRGLNDHVYATFATLMQAYGVDKALPHPWPAVARRSAKSGLGQMLH